MFSATPTLRDRTPVAVVLVADRGKVREMDYDLMTGAESKGAKKTASAR